jgi:hypothetical protein
MKRFAAVCMSLLLLVPVASADPLVLSENDLTETVTVFYNGQDDTDGRYIYSCRYPCVLQSDPEDLSAFCINDYYGKKLQEYLDFYIPSQAQEYKSNYQNADIEVSYEVTCNNDDFFSVLIRRKGDIGGTAYEILEGNTFSRSGERIGTLTSLPVMLGILKDGESDEWLRDRQYQNVWEAVCTLIWDAIQENPGSIEYYPDLSREDLESVIDPSISLEQDFWMDETGNVVFFILPGRVAPADAGLVTFTFSLENLRDEL